MTQSRLSSSFLLLSSVREGGSKCGQDLSFCPAQGIHVSFAKDESEAMLHVGADDLRQLTTEDFGGVSLFDENGEPLRIFRDVRWPKIKGGGATDHWLHKWSRVLLQCLVSGVS